MSTADDGLSSGYKHLTASLAMRPHVKKVSTATAVCGGGSAVLVSSLQMSNATENPV